MKRLITRVLPVVAALIALAVVPALAAKTAHLAKLNVVEDVSAGDGCRLDLSIKNRAGLDDVTMIAKDHEVRLTLPRTYVHPPSRTFGELGPCFGATLVKQIDPKTVRVQIKIKQGNPGDAVLSQSDDGLRLTLGSAPIAAAVEATEPAAEDIEDIPDEAKVDLAAIFGAALPTPAEQEAATGEAQPAEPEPAAADAPALLPEVGEGGFSMTGAATKMAVALCLSMALLMGLVAAAKRWKIPARLQAGRGGHIRVVQTGMLDMKRRIAVVDVAGELIVVALAGNQVTMLTKIESDAARRRLLGQAEPEAEPVEEQTETIGAEPIEPHSFGRDRQNTPAAEVEPATSFGAKLRAYSRHAPKESAVAGHDTLQAIADRVKELKRL